MNQEQVDDLYQSIMSGEASRGDLEAVDSMSTLWAIVVKVAQAIHLQEQIDARSQDYSALPVHVARFLGAFISSFEVVMECSTSDNSPDLISSFESVFINPGEPDKADIIVQLLRDYKDWFPFSYMFNRRTSKYPKSSFDTVNRYYHNRVNRMINASHTSSQDDIEDDETYRDEGDDDTLGDSFPNDSFPAITAPSIAPLNPFSADQYQLPPYSNRKDSPDPSNNSTLSSNRSENGLNIPYVPDEASIINSYYSNWNQIVEEDDDSDEDTQYYVARQNPQRMTRMKAGRSNGNGTMVPKKAKKMTRRKPSLDSMPDVPVASDRSNSGNNRVGGKSVTFSDKDEFDDGTKRNQYGDSSNESAEIRKHSEEDMVQGFDSPDEDDSPVKKPVQPKVSMSNERDLRASDESSLDLSDMERRKQQRQAGNSSKGTNNSGNTAGNNNSWTSQDRNTNTNGQNERRTLRSVLSDDESDDDRHQLVPDKKPNAWQSAQSNRKEDPWATNQPRQYRNPLDASLEDEEYRRQQQQYNRKDGDNRVERRNPLMESVEMDPRLSLDKNLVLSPPVKIPSIHASPHRYARDSDSEISPQPDEEDRSYFREKRSHPSFSSPSSLTLSEHHDISNDKLTSDKKSQLSKDKIDRLKAMFGKDKATSKDKENIHRPSVLSPKRDSSPRFSRSPIRMSEDSITSTFSRSSEFSNRRSLQGSRSLLHGPLSSSPPSRKPLRESTSRQPPNVRVSQTRPTPITVATVAATTIVEKKNPNLSTKEVLELIEGKKRQHNFAPLEWDVNTEIEKEVERNMKSIPSFHTPALRNRITWDQYASQEGNLIDVRRKSSDNPSVLIQSISQSMQSIFDKPFQEIPANITIPELSEFALETGVIIEGFLSKRSSMLGLLQKKYFILRESTECFCELLIYAGAVESTWGNVPIRLKSAIPIFDIASVETVGSKGAQGKLSFFFFAFHHIIFII